VSVFLPCRYICRGWCWNVQRGTLSVLLVSDRPPLRILASPRRHVPRSQTGKPADRLRRLPEGAFHCYYVCTGRLQMRDRKILGPAIYQSVENAADDNEGPNCTQSCIFTRCK